MVTLRSTLCALAAVAGLALGAQTATAATTAMAIDFDNPFVVAPGVNFVFGPFTTTAAASGGPYNGSNGKSWGGLHAYTQGTTQTVLQVSNLPAHTSLKVDFLLGFLNSWDSTDGSPAPDFLNISVDGGPVMQLTTVIAGGSVNFYAGGTLLVDNGQIDGDQFFADDLVDMGSAAFLTIPHTGSSLTVSWQAGGAGFQGGTDEYWGIDSLSVTLFDNGNGTPEPGTLALIGAIGIGTLVRRRRAR